MTAPHADQLIDGYLARICAAAHDFPAAARDELLDDMRSHIADARARDSQETDATILNILDRLGEPAVLVAEARERLGIKTQQPERPGLLEIAALVLLLFLWPAGVVLLWLSSQWKTRDKIIGSVFSLGGYPGISLIGLVLAGAGAGHGSRCITVRNAAGDVLQSSCSGTSVLDIIGSVAQTALVIVLFLLPVLTAAYLAIRLRRWHRLETIAA
ncbi:MAG: hypothetical protein E6I88_13265 [Chloroflexi bacterium]|nr:MAG: hypothetical protein E6I88_13265 [Chloroflexota bacterium]